MKKRPQCVYRGRLLCAVASTLLLGACSGGNGQHRAEPSMLGGTDSIDPQSSSRHGTLQLRETSDTTRIEKALNGGSQWPAEDVYLTPDARHLVAEYRQSDAGSDEQVIVWDMGTMRPIYSNIIGANLAFGISDDGSLLATAEQGGTTTLTNLKRPQDKPAELNTPCGSYISKIVFSSDGRHLMLSCEEISIWDIATGRYGVVNTDVKRDKNSAIIPIGSGSGNDIGFAADGTTVVAAAVGIGIGKIPTGQRKMRLVPCNGCGDENTNVFLSPDGRTVSFISETTAWIWDVNGEQQITHLSSRQYLNYGALLKLQDGTWVSFGFAQSKKATTEDLMEVFSPDGRSTSIASVSSIFHGKTVGTAKITPGGLLIAVIGEESGDPGSFRVLRFS